MREKFIAYGEIKNNTYIRQGVEFRNIEKFIEFLEENIKEDMYIVLDAYLDSLYSYMCSTGVYHYELSPYGTKDKEPHCINYEILYKSKSGIIYTEEEMSTLYDTKTEEEIEEEFDQQDIIIEF